QTEEATNGGKYRNCGGSRQSAPVTAGSRLVVGAGGYCGVQVDGISVKHVSQNHYPLSRRSDSNCHADVVGEIIVLKDGASARYLDAGQGGTPGEETGVRESEQAAVGPGNRLIE